MGIGTLVSGLYHHHALPLCFGNASLTTGHSPLLGYALDGFPIYGPYGSSNATNSASAIKKLTSSYYAVNYMNGQRTKYANGTAIGNPLNYGPSTSTTYQLNHLNASSTVPMVSGAFMNDYVFSNEYCDLNSYNGRFQITPEYPNGIFCFIMVLLHLFQH